MINPRVNISQPNVSGEYKVIFQECISSRGWALGGWSLF
jgi:hypothetical protein